jgi:ABC-2 type transport system ATP-binding protein
MTAAFALSGLSKRYQDFSLQDINLSMPEGQVMGLVGVNGAGKSTLLRLISGLARADSGSIEVLGRPMPEQQVAVKKELGFASDDMRLYKSQTLRWHMDFIRAIYPAWDEAYATDLLRRFDLRAEQTLAGFSHGQRVKALLLLNFARRPKLLLLDEPTTGLDPVARDEVLQALADILRDDARSVLFSSHNTADIEQLADTISFVHKGRLLESKDKESFLDDWRRIVCQGSWPANESQWPEIAATRQNGSLLELKVRQFSDGLLGRLQGQGLEIRSTEAMSLEDIFVTTVRAGGAA